MSAWIPRRSVDQERNASGRGDPGNLAQGGGGKGKKAVDRLVQMLSLKEAD